MDARIRRLGIALLALLGLVFAQVNRIQVVAAESIAANPANAARRIVADLEVARGRILARDGVTVLAESRPVGDGRYRRVYPAGPLYAPVTGHRSFIYGPTRVERAADDALAGRSAALLPATLVDRILGTPRAGGDVVTTIDPELQRAAADALGDRPGAVVAIDPATGDVLALVANPSYDPNRLAGLRGEPVRAAWDELTADPAQPLLSRASEELYPPGSTFKIITAAAALAAGYGPQSRWPNPTSLDLPDTTAALDNFGGTRCLGAAEEITLADAFRVSCNVTFGEIGLALGPERLVAQARAFGFGADPGAHLIPFDLPAAGGVVPDATAFADRRPAVAISAIGQADVLANPLQMALVSAAVANGGVLMRPRLLLEVRDPSGAVVERFGTEAWGRPMTPEDARALAELMASVVAAGTGTAAAIDGVVVAGKTGTAQHGGGPIPHAWFTGFAPLGGPVAAVAVLVLDGGSLGSEATGGRVAAPVARAVLAAALAMGAP
ncbi:MAG: penicillin-binding transpeptidase domain-containing protein [Actinomycetota bacterium]